MKKTNLDRIVRKLEKETGLPCELRLRSVGDGIKEKIYGDFDKREILVFPLYKNIGSDKRLLEEAEMLRGIYKNKKEIEDKIRSLGLELSSRKEDPKMLEEIRKKADELSTYSKVASGAHGKEEIFFDINKKYKLMKEEFRKRKIPFLNNSYIVALDGVYLRGFGGHPGFMEALGKKVAKIEYCFYESCKKSQIKL